MQDGLDRRVTVDQLDFNEQWTVAKVLWADSQVLWYVGFIGWTEYITVEQWESEMSEQIMHLSFQISLGMNLHSKLRFLLQLRDRLSTHWLVYMSS